MTIFRVSYKFSSSIIQEGFKLDISSHLDKETCSKLYSYQSLSDPVTFFRYLDYILP
jgi:hypothetical protein